MSGGRFGSNDLSSLFESERHSGPGLKAIVSTAPFRGLKAPAPSDASRACGGQCGSYPKSRSFDSAENRFAQDDNSEGVRKTATPSSRGLLGSVPKSRFFGCAEKRCARDDTSLVGGIKAQQRQPGFLHYVGDDSVLGAQDCCAGRSMAGCARSGNIDSTGFAIGNRRSFSAFRNTVSGGWDSRFPTLRTVRLSEGWGTEILCWVC